ncbi:hypothetical protein LCGC14_2549910 [marine sediment metagenome]|uniref:Major facilitator superfamily (MFS) profile domain-containing protein n=1 Tax=marine sediment metagenome TaxID=412755 RepID=A0A0F9ANP8_9ZZZZ
MNQKASKIIIICSACFFMGMAWNVLPIISGLLFAIGISKSEYSILTFTFVLAGLIFSSIAGIFGRIKGLKKVYVSGIFLCSFAMGLYALSYYLLNNLYLILLIGQFILGVGITSILTSISAYLYLYLPKTTAMILTGIFTCINLGSSSSPIFFNFLNSSNWGLNCLIISIALFIMFFLALNILPIVENPYIKKKCILKTNSSLLGIFFLTVILFALCELVFSYWGIIYLNQYKQINLQFSRFGLSSYWIAAGLSQLTICWLLKYIAPKYFYRILPVFLALGFLGMFFATKFITIVISFMLGGIGASAFIALTMNFVEHDFKQSAEIASGIMFMGYFLGYVIGSLAIAETIKFIDLSKIFLFSAFIAIFIEIFTIYIVKKSKTSQNIY